MIRKGVISHFRMLELWEVLGLGSWIVWWYRHRPWAESQRSQQQTLVFHCLLPSTKSRQIPDQKVYESKERVETGWGWTASSVCPRRQLIHTTYPAGRCGWFKVSDYFRSSSAFVQTLPGAREGNILYREKHCLFRTNLPWVQIWLHHDQL